MPVFWSDTRYCLLWRRYVSSRAKEGPQRRIERILHSHQAPSGPPRHNCPSQCHAHVSSSTGARTTTTAPSLKRLPKPRISLVRSCGGAQTRKRLHNCSRPISCSARQAWHARIWENVVDKLGRAEVVAKMRGHLDSNRSLI